MSRIKTAPPRGVLKTPVADPTRLEHVRYHPSSDLALYVEHFWAVRWDLRGVAPHRAETLPHPSVHLIFQHPDGGRISGVARGKFSRVLEGVGGAFAAKFRPGGFHPFSDRPVVAFANTTDPLGVVWGPDGDALEQAVLASTDNLGRIALVEDFLRARCPAADDNVALIGAIVDAIAADRAILKVDDIAARFGLSVRRMQRLFAQYVGANPKWVIQRYRLHEAAETIHRDASTSQSMLAIDLGYTDQAHFVRDFKALVGLSPAAYAQQVRDLSSPGAA